MLASAASWFATATPPVPQDEGTRTIGSQTPDGASVCPDQTALFVLTKPPSVRSGPAAAWATTAGWALGAERRLGHAQVLSPHGLLTPDEAYAQVTAAPQDHEPTRSRFRSALPEPLVTLLKDARNLWQALRSPLQGPDAPPDHRKTAFVWQRHELFRDDGRRIAEGLNAPLVICVHAMQVREAEAWGVHRPGWKRVTERMGEVRYLKQADVVACVSSEVASQVEAAGIPRARIVVTPNGVDTQHFQPSPRRDEIRQRFGLQDHFVIGWAGSFRRFHGLEVALEAVVELQRTRTRIGLVLYGDGQERANLEAHAQRLGIESVVFTGSIAYEDMPAYLSALDAGLVLTGTPDRFHYSPVKLREYMACKVPVVAHAVGELKDVIADGSNGVLAEPGNPSALAAGIDRLIADPDFKARVAESGFRMASDRWSWSRPVDLVLERIDRIR